ncbi:hypothetical protein [Streptomyces sp. NPDC051561]|uniref:hypothetical protein n=1 Tax=Streptomyces sp. NPDC051561 TaxID=3365658 RepID=UPI0037A46C16
MSTATVTPGAAAGMAGARTAGSRHSGATAISDNPHRVTRALRAVRIFAGAAVSVVLLGDHADDWREERPQPGHRDWRHERDAWADGRAGTSRE